MLSPNRQWSDIMLWMCVCLCICQSTFATSCKLAQGKFCHKYRLLCCGVAARSHGLALWQPACLRIALNLAISCDVVIARWCSHRCSRRWQLMSLSDSLAAMSTQAPVASRRQHVLKTWREGQVPRPPPGVTVNSSQVCRYCVVVLSQQDLGGFWG